MKVSFTIDGQEYKLKQITLEDHYAMQIEIALNPTPGFFIVSYLSGCPEEELRDLTVEQWDRIWTATQDYLKDQNDKNRRPSPIVKIDKVEYGLVNMEQMTIGEFADLDVILTSPDFEKRVHEAMAIIYRPVTVKNPDGTFEVEKYNIDTFSARAELFKKFPISEVRRSISFFLGFALQSIKSTLNSLDLEMVEKVVPEIREMVENLINHLDKSGMELSLPSLEETSWKWTEPVQEELKKPSTSSPTKSPSTSEEKWSLKKLIKNINFN